MVVGGVPILMSSHTERVANFALGMIIAAKEVTNPVTGCPIQVMGLSMINTLDLRFSVSVCNVKPYLHFSMRSIINLQKFCLFRKEFRLIFPKKYNFILFISY